jgi:non-specific serine/threonine protein kinase
VARLSSRLLTGGARDAEQRQQTMRSTLAWSYHLLRPAERRLFGRLGVFVGGCTLEAAEAVCATPEGAEPLGTDVLEGLGALVEHSLVQQREGDGEPRFSLLQVIREYALEQLDASAEAEVLHRAHATYYARLGDAAELHLVGWEQATWVEQLEREHDNLRAALRWLRDRGELATALRRAVAIGNFWFIRGHYEEGTRWLEDLLTRPETADPALRVRALYRVYTLASMRTRAATDLERLAEEALTLAHAAEDLEGCALALGLYADAAVLAGRVDQAVAYGEQAVEAARQAGARWTLGVRLHQLGYFLLVQGTLEPAKAAATEGLDLMRAQGDEEGQAFALTALGAIACREGDAASGRRHAEEAMALCQRLRHPSGMAAGLVVLAGVAALERQCDRAARLLGCADSVVGHFTAWNDYMRRALDAVLAPARAALGEDAWAAAFSAGKTLTLEEAVAEALGEEAPDA